MSDSGGDAPGASDSSLVRVEDEAGAVTRAGESKSFAVRWFRISKRAAALPLVGMVPMIVGLTQLGQGRDWLTFVLMGAGIATVVGLFAKAQRVAPVAGTATVTPRGLVWEGRDLLMPRGRISQATVSPGEHAGEATWEVHLGAPNGLRERLLAPDEASAHALVRALGLDPSRATAAFRTQGPVVGWPAALLMSLSWCVGMAGLFAALSYMGPTLAAVALGGAIAMTLTVLGTVPLMPYTVLVGSDGVRLERPMRAPVLVPYAQIARVDEDPEGVTLVKSDGTTLRLRIKLPRGMPPGVADFHVRERAALAARIRDAMRDPSAGPAVLDDAALARGDRDVRAWIAALRGLVARAEGGMRAAPVLRDQLWARVRDGRAPEADRAGAAVVLAKLGDGRDRALLEETARSLASTRLRVALECAAKQPEEGSTRDDAELERALETLTKQSDGRAP